MNKTLIILSALLAILCGTPQAPAQGHHDRSQWMSEVLQYKCTYLARELGLTKEQEQKFFPLYEEMEQQTSRMEEETRAMERRLSESDNVTDLEYEKASEALFDLKAKQGEVEKGYMEKYKTILTPRQLFLLKGVERQFGRDLMKQHQRIKQGKR